MASRASARPPGYKPQGYMTSYEFDNLALRAKLGLEQAKAAAPKAYALSETANRMISMLASRPKQLDDDWSPPELVDLSPSYKPKTIPVPKVSFKINTKDSKAFKKTGEGKTLLKKRGRTETRANVLMKMAKKIDKRPKSIDFEDEDFSLLPDLRKRAVQLPPSKPEPLPPVPKKAKRSSSKQGSMAKNPLLQGFNLDMMKSKARDRRAMPVLQTFPAMDVIRTTPAKKQKKPKQSKKPKKQIAKKAKKQPPNTFTPRAQNMMQDIIGMFGKKPMAMGVRKTLCRKIGAIRTYTRKKK